MDQITHNVRRNQWLNIVNACQSRTDNSTVREWLKANGIAYKSYYYWLRKFLQMSSRILHRGGADIFLDHPPPFIFYSPSLYL